MNEARLEDLAEGVSLIKMPQASVPGEGSL